MMGTALAEFMPRPIQDRENEGEYCKGLPNASSGSQLAVASPLSPPIGGTDTPVTPIASPGQTQSMTVDGDGAEAAATARETQVSAANAAAGSETISAAVVAAGKGASKGKAQPGEAASPY